MIPLLLWLTADALAADCAPLDAAGLRALVADAHDAVLDDDVVGHDALVDQVEARVPCLVEVVPADAWARLVYDDALVRRAKGEPWQPLVTAALAADPALDRSLGPVELRAFEPVPAPATVRRPDDVPDRWWLDGRPAPATFALVGPHVLQRRDAFGLKSTLVVGDGALPDWWAPEPAPVPVPGPPPEPRRDDLPTAASTLPAPPAPAVETPRGEAVVLRAHVATGLGVAFGRRLELGEVVDPAVQVTVPIEAGLAVDVGPGWLRLAGSFVPRVNGTWVYDHDGAPVATRLGGGLALSGGGRFGIGHVGALVGGQDPSRLVFQALGGVRVHDSGLHVELRAGVNLATASRVEPALGLLLAFAPRVWGR